MTCFDNVIDFMFFGIVVPASVTAMLAVPILLAVLPSTEESRLNAQMSFMADCRASKPLEECAAQWDNSPTLREIYYGIQKGKTDAK